VAELSGRDDADPEAGGHGLPNRLAAVHIESVAERQAAPGHRGLEQMPGRRSLLAQHQPLAAKLGQLDPAPPRPGMATRDEGDEPIAAERPGVEPRLARHIGQDRHVDLVLQKVAGELDRVPDDQGETDPRMPAGEGGKRVRDVVRRVGADPEMPLAQSLHGREQMLGLRLEGEEPPGQIQKLAAELGRRDLPAAAVEQADAIGLLHRLHLAGEGGLGHVQRRGGPGEAAFARNRVERPQLGMIHRGSLCEI